MPRPEDIPMTLEPASYDAIFDLMVNQPTLPPFMTSVGLEASLSGVMAYLLEEDRPDIILFPYKSAVPVVDSVRAYYEELGLPLPDLAVVNTKEDNRIDEYEDRGRFGVRRSSSVSDAILEREVPSLIPLVEGKSVAIIDHYIESMATLLRAEHIARSAGARFVNRPFAANWYHRARAEDIDFENLSSIHSEHMRNIGHAAAQFELPANWRGAYNWRVADEASVDVDV